ncbi:MAG: four helix bundle protein [Calditrichaeota bacterium]|nr:four helix bundle protein [Calditrichota bacterium]
MRNYDLQERLICLSLSIIDLVKLIKKDFTGMHLSKQLIRSGTSITLNYGEAQNAESRSDFVHKLSIILKELRESFACIELLIRSNLLNNEAARRVQNEIDQMIAILYKSQQTALKNRKKS